jgi:hypothetical protein
MRILLVNPPYKVDLDDGWERYFVRAGSRWPFSMVKRRGRKPDYYMPFPFYLAYAGALLEAEGYEVEVMDGVALDLDLETFMGLVGETRPEYIVYESATPTIDYDARVARAIKERTGARVIFTGPQLGFRRWIT